MKHWLSVVGAARTQLVYLCFVLMVLAIAAPVYAVTPAPDCGFGLPCGPMPWNLPNMPVLVSPTPPPNSAANPAFLTATPTPTPTTTVTATPSPTQPFDPAAINGHVQTLQAVMNGTSVPLVNLQGTPLNLSTEVGNLQTNTGTFWSYVKGVGDTFGTQIGLMISFTFVAFGVVATTKFATLILPVLMAIWGIIRKVIIVILEFIPF